MKGALRDEPFDRLTGAFSYANNTFEVCGGRVQAGQKNVELTGDVPAHAGEARHAAVLKFRVSTNVMPLADLATLQEARPGATRDRSR